MYQVYGQSEPKPSSEDPEADTVLFEDLREHGNEEVGPSIPLLEREAKE